MKRKDADMKGEFKSYRPIELVHDFKFIPCCFLQDVTLPPPRERLDRLKALGYGGVAICPSYNDYLSKESFDEAREIIKYAKQIGLSVWIYDEKYYPSGGADGKIARENPRLEAKALAAVIGEPDEKGVICINSPHGYGDVKYAFAVDLDENGVPNFKSVCDVSDRKTFGGGILLNTSGMGAKRVYAFFGKNAFEFSATSHVTRGVSRYTDTLMPEATEAFLHKTFDGYEKLGDLSEYVEAIFTDEPQIPALCRMDYTENYRDEVLKAQNNVFKVRDLPDSRVAFTPYMPWTEGFEKAFISRHGYDLLPLLPQLFFDGGEDGQAARRDFWETASELFREGFGGVYSSFCKSRGVSYTGHLLYEEEFELHPYMHGDALSQLGMMDIPGCDMLFASPKEIFGHASAIKLAASAAQLYGKSEVMIEASNICKDVFPITERAFKLATALEAALGATRFLSYYTETALGAEETRRCCDFTDRLLTKLSDMTPVRRVFVYIPNEEIWKECYPSVSASEKRTSQRLLKIKSFLKDIAGALARSGIDFCYINGERLSSLKDSGAFDGAALVLPPSVRIPEGCDGFAEAISELDADAAVKRLSALGYRNISAEAELVCLKKASQDRTAFLVVNVGEAFSGKLKLNTEVPLFSVPVYDPDTDTSEACRVNADSPSLSIGKGECRIFFVNNN